MTPALFVGGFGVGIALLMWLASRLKTTPKGYTRIGTFDTYELAGVERILAHAGIPSILDDHSFRGRGGGSSGFIHVLVPDAEADGAIALLKRESKVWNRPAPPA